MKNSLSTITGIGTDEDGDALTYRWEGPSGIFFENPDSAQTRFIAPSVEHDTTYVLTFTVSDGGDTSKDFVEVTVLNRVSANQFENAQLVKVYPNPANDHFTVKFYVENNQNVKIKFSTITGQTVYQQQEYYTSGNNAININRSQLNTSSKILFYQLQFENKASVTGKLILK